MKTKLSVLIAALAMAMLISTFPIPKASAVKFAEEGSAYFVVFSGPNLPADANAIIADCGGAVTAKFPKIGVLVAMPTIDPATFEVNLDRKNEITDFGHDYTVELPPYKLVTVEESVLEGGSGPVVTDSFYWAYQWHLWHTTDVNPEKVWSITTGNPNVKVGILDTGIDYMHNQLGPNYDWVLSTSFVPTEPDPRDYNGHGSWCAGLVAAPIDGRGTVGIGPNLKIVSLKVLNATGSGYFSWLIQGVYYAVENGIDVITMSLGAYVPMAGGVKNGGSALFSTLQRVFNYANRNGVVCIASAGNGYNDMDGVSSWRHLPSQCSNVICVLGTNIYDDIALDLNPDGTVDWGSNYGSCLHGISSVAGDWADIEPTWYRSEFPTKPKAPTWLGYYGYPFSTTLRIGSSNYYGWYGGTSMASPHVAGVAGLILSINPDFNPLQVRHFLLKGAKDIGAPGYDQFFNFGLLNAYNSVLLAAKSKILLDIE